MNNPAANTTQARGGARLGSVGGTIHQFVTFYLNGELLGINILKVQEIQLPQPITPVPRAQRNILGLISLRGQVVTLSDLRFRLGMKLSEPIAKPYHIVVNTSDTIACLLVDEIGDVIDVPQEKLVAPPESVKEIDADFLDGIYQFKGGILSVLNVNTVLEIE